MTKADVKRNALVSIPGMAVFFLVAEQSRGTAWAEDLLSPGSLLLNAIGLISGMMLIFGVFAPICITVFARSELNTTNESYHGNPITVAVFKVFEISDWEPS